MSGVFNLRPKAKKLPKHCMQLVKFPTESGVQVNNNETIIHRLLAFNQEAYRWWMRAARFLTVTGRVHKQAWGKG